MKKKIAMMLLTVMTLSLAACGGQNDGNESQSSQPSSSVEESAAPSGDASQESSVETPATSTNEIASAVDVLNTVWGNYKDEKFPVGGGDSANLNFEGPGAFDVTNTEELNVTLGFPAEQVDKIDDAASMMNAMMANNFTAGVYHVTDAANVQAVADAVKATIMEKQWMCGMPEKMIVVSVDNYVISAFGLNAAIDPFKTAISESYENVTVLYEEIIAR